MSEQNKSDVLGTLTEIRDLLTPKATEPIKIPSNDQTTINANIDAIAKGDAVVMPAEVQPPTYGAGVRKISRSDQRALSENLDAIASGAAVVV